MATNTEVEIIKYEGDITNLQKQLRTAEGSFSSVEKSAKTSVDKTKASFNGLGDAVKNVLGNLGFGEVIDQLEGVASSTKEVASGLYDIGSAAKNSEGGIFSLGNALKTGVLAVLGLIIFAFTSVLAFIRQTDEGAVKLEATIKGLGAALDVVTGRLAGAGEKVVTTFEEAGETLDQASESNAKFGASLLTLPGLIKAVSQLLGDTGLGKDAKAAFTEAARLSTELSDLQTEMRNVGVATRQTELNIEALIKQSKDKGLDISDRLALVDKAFQLENSNLETNFDLQKKYYQNIANTNFLKTSAINSDKQAQLLQVKGIINQVSEAKNANDILDSFNKQIAAQKGLLNISAENAELQANAATALIELDGESQVQQERFNAIKSNYIEQYVADQIDGIKSVEREETAHAINTINNEKDLANKTLSIQIASLEKQKGVFKDIEQSQISDAKSTITDQQQLANKITSIQEKYGRDVSQIDLDIANLKKKNRAENAAAQAKSDADDIERGNALTKAENALIAQRTANEAKGLQDQLANSKGNLYERINIIEQIGDAQIKQAQADGQKLLSQGNLLGDERIAIEEATGQKIQDITSATQKAITDEEKKEQQKRKQQVQQATDFAANAANELEGVIYQAQQQQTQASLDQSQKVTDQKIADLQTQKDASANTVSAEQQYQSDQLEKQKDAGLITEQKYQEGLQQIQAQANQDGLSADAKYNAQVQRLQDAQTAKENAAKTKQAKADKEAALFQIAISTAQAVIRAVSESPETFGVPFSEYALATGAIEAAIVAARPLPKYKDGVIGLRGPGTTTSDSIPAMLSVNESVMTAQETAQHKDALWAMRNKTFDRYVNRAWVMPALDKLEKQRKTKQDYRDRSMMRIAKSKQLDLDHLERLTARNGTIRIRNVEEIAEAVSRKQNRSGII